MSITSFGLLVDCPVCAGTGRVEPSESMKPYLPPNKPNHWWGYRADDQKIHCRNCGGQTMYGQPTGKTRLRPDNAPCTHEYQGREAGRCYTIYTCKHCGDTYDIDSSD